MIGWEPIMCFPFVASHPPAIKGECLYCPGERRKIDRSTSVYRRQENDLASGRNRYVSCCKRRDRNPAYTLAWPVSLRDSSYLYVAFSSKSAALVNIRVSRNQVAVTNQLQKPLTPILQGAGNDLSNNVLSGRVNNRSGGVVDICNSF